MALEYCKADHTKKLLLKLPLMAIGLLNLLSCRNPVAPNKEEVTTVAAQAVSNNKQRRTYTCDFDRFLQDPHTPELARNIYLDKEWNLNKDDEALALLDSLTAKDKMSRPFYFKVVTKSYRKSDGYYSSLE